MRLKASRLDIGAGVPDPRYASQVEDLVGCAEGSRHELVAIEQVGGEHEQTGALVHRATVDADDVPTLAEQLGDQCPAHETCGSGHDGDHGR